MIVNLLIGSYGLSTLVTLLTNSAANSKIKRKGYKIKNITANSIAENILYFFKDYGHLLIPVLNLIKSLKISVKFNDFVNKKFEKLDERDRLEEVGKEYVKPSKKKEEKEVIDEEEIKEEKKDKKATKEKTTKKEKTLDEMDCYERRDFFEKQYKLLVARHSKAKEEGKPVSVLNLLVSEMKKAIENYNKAYRECKLIDLTNERDFIKSGNSKKLSM